ncbi:hypothetical protein [Paraliomyxa miuraensis]|uniref:hypothetical protein n=1 Tax=Paraliomyxa miuraensis TaxID=376150 RepID=UPI0022528587|nr:hypothetical protein [Paraliomyxa miuraensis]MCX4243984.1 hypothetical protein [Paraliomyxa miuraensis]
MTLPSLPRNDTSEIRAERARALAWAKTLYTWTHSHTYELPEGKTLTLEGLALLAIDAEHPFPCLRACGSPGRTPCS